MLRVPRTSISGVRCLQFSEPVSEGKHHHLSFSRGQTACDSPEVMAENPHANKLLCCFVFLCVILCLLWEIMQCLKVLAQIVTSTCQGIPHVEWMQEIKQIFFPYWKLFLFFFFCRIFLLLDSFPYVFVSTSLTRSVRT